MSSPNSFVFGLTGAKQLTARICKYLKCQPSPITISHFADGEIMVRPEISVRSKCVTIIQSLVKPVNENLMELLIAIDAMKRASASEINVIIPYLAYARQDRKTSGREPITSKLVAGLIEKAGATRVAIVDIHSEQTQGFFEMPMDMLKATFITIKCALSKVNRNRLTIVSPDYGAVKRARSIAKVLNVPLAILDKRRPKPNQAEISNVLGDVKNYDCIISDDMVDTGGTITAACETLKKKGARNIILCATHAVLSGKAIERLTKAINDKIISHIYFTDSINYVNEVNLPNTTVCSLDKYLAKVINVYHSRKGSISEVYEEFVPNKF
ncbi:MAG: ribose-phosphate pyrophosphokinase [Mycoplasmataceae bacterium]|nr:ribose-phosphate pyrophosphokinase [Mycoplasmataceae bacterium]